MRKIAYLLCLLLLSSLAWSQSRTVSGKITDTADAPIAGATVTVKGTTVATQTASDGSFRIAVPAGKNLTVSFVGYATRDVALGDQNTVSISMSPSANSLNTVVITGYQSQRKADLTGSV